MENLSSAQSISDLKISCELSVPLRLVRSLRQRNYADGVALLKDIAISENMLKQHRRDIERIKATFEQIYKHAAYFTNTPEDRVRDFDAMIAFYVDAIGVDGLEKNMLETSLKRGHIRSIVFFFFTKNQTSPWEKLRQSRYDDPEPAWVNDDRERYHNIQMRIFEGGYPLHLRKDMMHEMNVIKRRLRINGYNLKAKEHNV